MANENFIKWHIAGLHALRSASEQGAETAHALAGQVKHPELKSLLDDYGQTAAQQQERFVNFLKEFDTQPNDFKDRIMEGIGKGTSEMVKAAPDDDVLNLSAVSGSQSGIDYYVGAFKGQGALAKQLGHAEQSDALMAMSEACKALGERFTQLGDTIRAKATAEA